MFSKVSKIGDQLFSYQIGGRVYLDQPNGGPDWGLRLGPATGDHVPLPDFVNREASPG